MRGDLSPEDALAALRAMIESGLVTSDAAHKWLGICPHRQSIETCNDPQCVADLVHES